jgi:hypothetical protein
MPGTTLDGPSMRPHNQLMPDLRVHELVFCAGYLALGRASGR